jgi:ketosteroid isomerase-like protein
MTPLEVTQQYFACMRARDIDGLMALYADEATFTLPSGRSFNGKAAIREMHLGVFAAGAPVPKPIETVVGEHSAAVEIQARLPDGTVRQTANFYYLNDSARIRALSVYMRGG